MSQEYFTLQFKRINRYINEFGLHPILGYLLAAILFWGLSEYLFHKTVYASYLYIVIALSIFNCIKNHNRFDFFKTIFSSDTYRKIRIIEHLIISLPFGIFLIYKGHLILALVCLVLAVIIALLPPIQYKTKTIPTPFSSQPFEFAIGIRNSYLLYFGLYFILFMAVRVDNFNLGIATLLATFVMSITFYSKLEAESYIWNYSGSASSFLKNKLVRAIGHASLLSIPIFSILMLVWPSQWLYIIGLQVIGYLYLIAFILAKYSAYPRMMSLPQGLILLFCFWIPPLLLFVIPYLFLQSNRKLKCLLS